MEKNIEGELVPIDGYVPGHEPTQCPKPECVPDNELEQIYPEFFHRRGTAGEILDKGEEA